MKNFELDKEPKIASGFKVPEHYFEHFSAKLMSELPQNKPKVIPLFSRKTIWIYVAAAVLVAALAIPIANSFKNTPAEIDNATLENYLADHANISNADLAEFLEVEDIQNIPVHSNLEDKAVEDLLSTNSNLEDYIIN